MNLLNHKIRWLVLSLLFGIDRARNLIDLFSLTDENVKVAAEAQDWRAKFDEKSRQKRKLYELYTAVKQKGVLLELH